MEELRHLLVVQDGVVARRQLVGLGLHQSDVTRMLRRRDLARVHPGVYVDHTGSLTWEQRAWAAVLAYHPSALTLDSALPDPPQHRAVHVAIDSDRTVVALPGVVAHRTARWRERLAANASRPRLALPEAAVEVAARATDPWSAFACFARVCHTRRTHPGQIAEALRRRRGVPQRALLIEMLEDLAAGACSVLEREYLARVERAHGLPTGVRQGRERAEGGVVYRDVDYPAYGVLVELDGRAGHADPDGRDADLERDLDAVAVADRLTLRLGYRQVLRTGCRTAGRVAAVLRRRGWDGRITPCASCPPTSVDLWIAPTR